MNNSDNILCHMQTNVNDYFENEKLKSENMNKRIKENIQNILENEHIRLTTFLIHLYDETEREQEKDDFNYMFFVYANDIHRSLNAETESPLRDRAIDDLKHFISEKDPYHIFKFF